MVGAEKSELVRAAWADRIITEKEEADLRLAADLLGLPEERVAASLTAAPEASGAGAEAPIVTSNRPADGAQIVLTGQMSRKREVLESHLADLGYVPSQSVTKMTSLVVAADPDSLSGKAAKARKYGVPVAGEHYLYEVLGVPAA